LSETLILVRTDQILYNS